MVIQAELGSKERDDGVIPSFQGQVIRRLVSRVLLLNACVASAKEMGVSGRTQVSEPSLPWRPVWELLAPVANFPQEATVTSPQGQLFPET